MSAKHTPGPWLIDADDLLQDADSVFSIGVWSGEGDARTMVANITAFGLHSEHFDGVEYVTTAPAEQSEMDTATANARLIAAAPELLEALQGLDEAYCRAGATLTSNERTEDRKRLIAARAAIAKATGAAA